MTARRLQWIFFLAPQLVMLILFVCVPVAAITQMSFHLQGNGALTGTGFSLTNYIRLADPYYLGILVETVKLSLISTVIVAILSYPAAYVLARASLRLKTILMCLLIIPLMTSIVIKVFGWYILLGRRGMISSAFSYIGIGNGNLLNNEGAVIAGLVEYSIPFMAMSLAASIERIPISIEEAASNLGASPLGIFFKVILPLSRAGLLSGFLLCFSVSSSAYVVPALLGGTRVRMAAQQVYDDVLVAFNWPGASALAVVLLVILGSVQYVAMRMARRSSHGV